MSSYPEHILLTSQTDEVYGIVRSAGFDPNEFTWGKKYGEVYGAMVPVLIHKPTSFDFVFDFDPKYDLHAAEWSPGEETPRDKSVNLQWPLVLQCVSIWLENVERERSTPDLWAQLEKQRELLAASAPFEQDDANNSPFTPDEQQQIEAQLDEIKELLVQTHQADGRALESSIEYLREASTRMGRRDWLTIFIGTIFGWALNGLVPPEGVRQALALAAHGLGHLFGGGVPQLPIA
jgi:hypothetical protein